MSNVVGSKAVEKDVRTNSPSIGSGVSPANPFDFTKSGRSGEKREETCLAVKENQRGGTIAMKAVSHCTPLKGCTLVNTATAKMRGADAALSQMLVLVCSSCTTFPVLLAHLRNSQA